MNLKPTVAITAIILAGAVATAGAITRGPRPGGQPAPMSGNGQSTSGNTQPMSGVGVALSVDKTAVSAKANAPTIHATLSLFNHTGTPLKIMEPGYPVDWQIADSNGQIVWDFLKGKRLPHNVRILTLSDTASFQQEIAIQSQGGQALKPGSYSVRARLRGGYTFSAEAGFTVE